MKTFALLCAAATMVALCASCNSQVTAKGPKVMNPDPSILSGVRSILFYGDSLTDGSSYPDYVINTLNAKYPEAKLELENSAKCGDKVADLLARFDTDVTPKKPDLVVIGIGTNDVWRKNQVENFRRDYITLIDRVRALPAKPVLLRPSCIGDPKMDAEFKAFLTVIDELGAEKKCPVIDVYGYFTDWKKAGKEVLGPDNIHHGPDGFECMARAVLAGLGAADAEPILRPAIRPGAITRWDISDPADADAPLTAAANWKPLDYGALITALPWYDKPFAERGAAMPAGKLEAKKIVFARATVTSPAARQAVMELGGSVPMRVWLNGTEVWSQTAAHGYHANADRVTVELKAGENQVVVSTSMMAFIGIRP